MVGESYKLYAERMYGRARAAERDRDEMYAYIAELEARSMPKGAGPPERRFSAGA